MKKRSAERRQFWLYRERSIARHRAGRVAPTRSTEKIEICLAGDLDLINNPEETRHQLDAFRSVPRPPMGRRLRVRVNMTEVVAFDACALLYPVAQVDRLGHLRGVKVSGNYPRHEQARLALYDAQFERFMHSKVHLGYERTPDARSLRILSGSSAKRLNPTDWLPLHAFLKTKGNLSPDDADAFYAAFGECVENVRQHAYRLGTIGRWYALAIGRFSIKASEKGSTARLAKGARASRQSRGGAA